MREQIVKLALKITEHYVANSCICARSWLRSLEKNEGTGRQDKIIFTPSKSPKGKRHLGMSCHMGCTQAGRVTHVEQHICCTKVGTQAYRQRGKLEKGKALDYFKVIVQYTNPTKCTNLPKQLCNRLLPGLLQNSCLQTSAILK